MREKITKNRNTILMVLGILILSALYVSMKYIMRPKYEPLPVVKLKDKETNKKKFAVMVQNGDGYVEYTSEDGKWPTEDENYIYTFKEAKCVDNNDNVVNNAVTFADGKVTLKTNKTIYCTLYFDKQEIPKEPLEITNVSVNSSMGSIVELTVSAKGGSGKYTYSVESTSCYDNCGKLETNCGDISTINENIITIENLSPCGNPHTFNVKVTDSYGNTAGYQVKDYKLTSYEHYSCNCVPV